MRSLSLILVAPLAAACASTAVPTESTPAETAPANACSPDSLACYTGLAADNALAARMMRETGRTDIRLVKPGMAVTMDFREDRLTVYLDAANKVERASCS